MKRRAMFFCGLLSLASLAPASVAAMDCKHALSPADKTICAHLIGQDDAMNRAYAAARRRAGRQLDALIRDQRNWLSERNALLLLLGPGLAGEAYEMRTEFLSHLFVRPSHPDPLLAGISARLKTYPPGHDGTTISPRRVFTDGMTGLSTGVALDGETGQGQKPVAAIRRVLSPMDEPDSSNRRFVWFPQQGLAYTTIHGGAGDYVAWTLAHLEHGTATLIETPKVFANTAYRTVGWLLTYHGHVYAMEDEEGKVNESDLTVQRYRDGIWGPRMRMLVRYDRQLSRPESYCNEPDCGPLQARAASLLEQFLRDSDVDRLVRPLSPRQAAVQPHAAAETGARRASGSAYLQWRAADPRLYRFRGRDMGPSGLEGTGAAWQDRYRCRGLAIQRVSSAGPVAMESR